MTRDITPAGWPATGLWTKRLRKCRRALTGSAFRQGSRPLGTMTEADVTAACERVRA